MSQREMSSATSANAAPVSTAGPWMLPYNSRKVEEDPPSDAIASSHIQIQGSLNSAASSNDFSWLQHGQHRGGPDLSDTPRKKFLEKQVRRAANELNPRRAGRIGVPVPKRK